jgi:integrase
MSTTIVPTAWAEAITEWSTWLRAAHRPETSIYLRTYHLRRLAVDHPDPFQVELADLIGWLARPGWAAETCRSYRTSIRGFYSWAHSVGRIAVNPAIGLPAITVPRGTPRPAPEPVYTAAVAGADARVALMLRLARQQGLRRGEIARVHAHDVQPDLLGWSLRVHGKGGVVRMVPLLDELAEMLRSRAGFVFPGRIGGHLSPHYVGKLISAALGPGWTAHPLRHAFATRAHAASGHDLRVVQELLGHASIATTQRYVAVDEQAKRDTVRRAA